MKWPFDKLLVANRGEIACRILRSARVLGLRTVAVHSRADAQAPHVGLADEAVDLGGHTAAESYLRIEALLEAARRTGAQAVHPGYGFLSERADFARACLQAGLVFVGPPPEAIAAMGDKALAKQRMLAAGVACVPGYLGEDQSAEAFGREAARIGYPLLVKAVAGGGGRGMRRVDAAAGLPAQLEAARREAKAAFGEGALMLERLVEHAHHVEIQVFADAHGHVVHLGERDCSAQRRRQKVIEETPSPVVDPALRERLARDAVAAARAVGYVGAGTVEFLVDAQGRHYFLEMNTRLQVEHPVTECVTGLDLVAWQLRVAAGEPLPLAQQEIVFSGHAIEARLVAEDPCAGFAPRTGRILAWRPGRARAAGIRIDDGVREGGEVPPFYDGLLAKLVAHGRDRAEALRRLRRALEDAPLLGVATNAAYLRALLGRPEFEAGTLTTSQLDQWCESGDPMHHAAEPAPEDWHAAAAFLAAAGLGAAAPSGPRPRSVAWGGLELACAGQARRVRTRVEPASAAGMPVQVEIDDGTGARSIELHPEDEEGWRPIRIDGVLRRGFVVLEAGAVHLWREAAAFRFETVRPGAAGREADARAARAPVAGRVLRVAVAAGDRVAAGQPLVCVEAMKMEMWVAAPRAGRVAVLAVAADDAVAAGAVLAEIDPDEPAPAAKEF